MFLKQQISILEWFLKDHVTMKTGVMAPDQLCIFVGAGQRLIAINHIQNKSFCIHNMCVYCVYLLRMYKYTCMYIFKIFFNVYILNIFEYNINYMNINIYM